MMPQTLPTASRDRVATITPGDVRQLLADTAVAVLRGEITTTQADRIVRDCGRITRELNQRVGLAARIVRLSRRSKPK